MDSLEIIVNILVSITFFVMLCAVVIIVPF